MPKLNGRPSMHGHLSQLSVTHPLSITGIQQDSSLSRGFTIDRRFPRIQGVKASQHRPTLPSKHATAFQIKGPLNHHVSPNPREPRRPRVMTKKHKRPLSLLISCMNSTFPIQKYTLKVFLGIHIDKGIEASQVDPKSVPIQINLFALTGLPSLNSIDCSPLISQQHQLAPFVGNAHFAVTPHLYERATWSELDRWMSKHTCSPPVANLQKWLRWRNKFETSPPTLKSSPGRTKSVIKSSCSAKLKGRMRRTKGRIKREVMPSRDKNKRQR